MNTISRYKVLLAIIAILLIANIAMLVLFFNIKQHHEKPKPPGFTERLKTEVGFTQEQMRIYEPKKKTFWDAMRIRFDSIKSTKVDFYKQMYDPAIPDSVILSKAEQIGNQQKDLDIHVFRHFREVRTLCTPQQLQKFDSLLPSIIDRMTARPERRK